MSYFVMLIGFWCLIVLIVDGIHTWPRTPKPPRIPKPAPNLNQRDWMEDFNLWVLRRRSKASPSSTAVGAYRLSGSALSSANKESRFRL